MIWGKTLIFWGTTQITRVSLEKSGRFHRWTFSPQRSAQGWIGWSWECGPRRRDFGGEGRTPWWSKRLPFEAWRKLEEKKWEKTSWSCQMAYEFPTLEGLVSCHFCESSAEMKWKQIVGSTCFGHDNWSNRWLNNDMRYNEEAIHSAIVLSCTWLDFNHISLKKNIYIYIYTYIYRYMDTTDTTIHVLICSTSLRGNALFIQESGILEVPPGGGRLIQVLEVNGGWGGWRWFGLWKQMKGWWLMIQARWWQLIFFWNFHLPKFRVSWSKLTSIFFRWVGSTTKRQEIRWTYMMFFQDFVFFEKRHSYILAIWEDLWCWEHVGWCGDGLMFLFFIYGSAAHDVEKELS